MVKIIFNNIIPFSGFKACAIFPWVFVRNECKERFTAIDSNHETIHGKQQIEMLWALFFVWYGIEWFVRWVAYGFEGHLAYRNISFEQEAYLNETDLTYIKNRHLFASWKYLFRKTYHRK